MSAGDFTPARRIPVPESGNINEVIWDLEPGDYCGPYSGYNGDAAAVSFLLPIARDPDVVPGARSLHHVTSPPHVFRECADGSLEIRESIGAMPHWHGYLDEGNVWREV